MGFNTFDEVADWYNRTPPIRGKRKAWDLRPIGFRNRPWERIVKIDDNTYALHDRWDYSSTREEYTEEKFIKNKYEIKDVAPIVWSRRKGGDYVRIRSCINYNGVEWCPEDPNPVEWVQSTQAMARDGGVF